MLLGLGAAAYQHFGPPAHAWAEPPSAAPAQVAQANKTKAGKSEGASRSAPGQGLVLPIPEPDTKPITEIDARNAKAPPRFEVKPPRGAPDIVIVLLDDIGFGHSSAFGGPINEDSRAPGQEWPEVQSLPHVRPMLPHAHGTVDGTQPPFVQRGRHHGTGHRLSGQHRRASGQYRHLGRNAALVGLHHRRLRQVSRDGGVGDQPFRPVRALADAFGVRQVLRLPRRRDEPVFSVHLRRRDPRGTAARPELPLHDRHDDQGYRVDALDTVEFAYAGGPPGSGGTGTIFVNDKKVAEGKIANTLGYAFGIDETADVGLDEATPVTEDYPTGHANRFNGRIRRITIELK
jgi:hypothetical protein